MAARNIIESVVARIDRQGERLARLAVMEPFVNRTIGFQMHSLVYSIRQITLRIRINKQNFLAEKPKGKAQINTSGGLCTTTLIV